MDIHENSASSLPAHSARKKSAHKTLCVANNSGDAHLLDNMIPKSFGAALAPWPSVVAKRGAVAVKWIALASLGESICPASGLETQGRASHRSGSNSPSYLFFVVLTSAANSHTGHWFLTGALLGRT
eukprot:SAG31_NODE_935_length_10892_cov_7.109886_9_plen_127_part_00